MRLPSWGKQVHTCYIISLGKHKIAVSFPLPWPLSPPDPQKPLQKYPVALGRITRPKGFGQKCYESKTFYHFTFNSSALSNYANPTALRRGP